MAARTKTAGARACATGRQDGNTKQYFRPGQWRIRACQTIGNMAVAGSVATLLLLVVGALQ